MDWVRTVKVLNPFLFSLIEKVNSAANSWKKWNKRWITKFRVITGYLEYSPFLIYVYFLNDLCYTKSVKKAKKIMVSWSNDSLKSFFARLNSAIYVLN